MPLSLLPVCLLLAAGAPFDPSTVSFDKTSDLTCPDSGFAYQARVGCSTFHIFTDPAGTPVHVYRLKNDCAAAAPQGQLWDRAEPAGPGPASGVSNCGRQGWGWETNNPTPGIIEQVFAQGSDYTLKLPKIRVKLRAAEVDGAVKGCKDLRIFASSGGAEVLLAEDRCRPGEEAFQDVTQWTVENAVAATQDRIALSLVAERYAGRNDLRSRGRVVVVDHRTFLGVDLLDAGAGSKLDDLATRVASAGFRVVHRGKAKTARATTDIYFGADFEAEARQLAKAIGLPREAVQPLTWKSGYAITVAAGTK
jgi:hypothetical protein